MNFFYNFFLITLFLLSQELIAAQKPKIPSGFVMITYARNLKVSDATVQIVSISSFPYPGHISDGKGGGQFVAGFIHPDGKRVKIKPGHLAALCANPQWQIIREPEIFESYVPFSLDPIEPD